MRPLIRPPNWDGKLVLAALFFAGYYALVFRLTGVKAKEVPAEMIPLIRDAMLVLGPALGVIVGAIYRSTASEERNSARQAESLRTAIETPTTVLSGTDLGDQVESGAKKGARDGVVAGLNDLPDDEAPEILK